MFEKILLGFISGIVQGVTEWLPVSSKTMLFFIFHMQDLSPTDSYMLSLLLNGSTVLAASIYFRRELYRMLQSIWRRDSVYFRLLVFLIISTFVTGVLGIFFSKSLINLLSELSPRDVIVFVGAMLSVTAFLNWWRRKIKSSEKMIDGVNTLDALLIGIAQSFSVIPGVSRSGVTVLALVLRGYNVKDSLIISFLMSIPATLGGSIYSYIMSPKSFEVLGLGEVLLSIAVATIISLVMIPLLLKLSHRFRSDVFLAVLSFVTVLSGLFFS